MSLTARQAEIAKYVARGLSDKAIARKLDLSPNTVGHHIQEAAARIPGDHRPRYKLILWVLSAVDDE